MVKKSMPLNAVVNGLQTALKVIFPLITYPYISRVLRVNQLGKFNFAASIVSYVTLLAGLGISTYAVREGAKFRDDRDKISKFVSEVFTINIISTIIAYALLVICVEIVSTKLKSYSTLIYTLSISVFFTTLGCEWVYQIYEEYVYIAIRGITFQLLSLLLMFTTVKTKDDLLRYAMISVIASSGSNIVNMFGLHKYCKIRISFDFDIKKRLAPILVLFANTLATTLYVNSDTTILGFLSGDRAVGIYSVSTKVYILVKQLLSAVIIVSIPRLSYFWGSNELDEFTSLGKKIINSLIVVVLPATVGLFSLSKYVVLFISAPEFVSAEYSMRILSVALFFSLFSWFYTSCILIPAKKEKTVLKATIFAACINIGLNFVLIPVWQERAAALTTVIAEACSFLICFIASKRVVLILPNKQNIVSVLVGCIYIYFICLLSIKANMGSVPTIIISIILSAGGYLGILKLLKNDTFEYLIGSVVRRKR